ncbi:alpha/beta fold hydrolase [Streptomyces sp. P1-3]|uniref:thioesterase II family protein n=1 Tax=Streptomyces sp. P1-3 TaxID=3421658 RepID=UPI003D36BB22
MTLVCLPHAGGTAGMFAAWHPLLPADVELISVQYPGRQDRLTEPHVEDLAEVADRVAAELGELPDRPVALFGHSVGSAIAYEIAVRLERDTGHALQHVFVSAREAPHRKHGEEDHRLGDEDLIAAIRQLGGRDLEALNTPRLWPIILPPLRADLRMADRYRPTRLEPLHAPITAFGGAGDHTCAPQDLETWRDATAEKLDVQVFRGKHHYLTEDPAPVVEAITQRLRAGTPEPSSPLRTRATPTSPPTSLEQEIAALWRKNLGGGEVGVDDDFFELGGNSLAGMKIIDQMREIYGVELSVRAFYLAQTPTGVAGLIEKERATL